MSEIWTVGHWTCPEPVFLALLDAQRIDLLVDVRAHPGSRTSPQFGRDTLRGALERAEIGYVHLPELGGRRPRQDVPPEVNGGWRVQSFHNYADYTLSPGYEDGVARLRELATGHRVVCMCAEPMPWRCHRLLIANTLVDRGVRVWHLLSGRSVQPHVLGRWGARPVRDAAGRLTYPAAAADP